MPKRKRGVYETISSIPNMLVNIPHDVVVDQILEKLPVKSLLRFRAVSKQWRTEIESPRFQERHLRHQQKSRDPSILICHPRLEKRGKASLRSLSVGATLVSEENHIRYPVASKREINVRTTRSCDGLACLYSSTFIYVINPATRWHHFKHLLKLHITALTAFDALSWDSVKTISQGCTRLFGCTTLITFAVMAKIPVAYAPHHRITMCTLNDRLCLSEDKGDTQTIWSLNQDNVTWDKTYSINLRSTLNCIEEKYLYSMPPVASLFDNRLLLYDCSDDEGKLVLYNFRLNSYGKFFTEPRYYLGSAVPYFQSLFTLR
ncbi:BnaAnng05880D [Brassica napus]|uniref:BnaAnng05880D protein n=1 Tax=Brassica napus TaxID=3708 RepID=A0A078HQ61_BRANA|nr:BnaAnng05880D [Brassica napus]